MARVGALIRRIVAEAMERVDDSRLDFVSVTGVDVDRDLFRAVIWFTTLEDDCEVGVLAALEEHSGRLRRAVANRSRLRKTPELVFRPDPSLRAAERIESLIAAGSMPDSVRLGRDVLSGDDQSLASQPVGIVVIDKPAGWTSHDVVAKCRGLLGTRKVGHGGTLDPDATGVLVLGVGAATRLLRFVTALQKSYEGEIVLGVETDTLDASGSVTARHDMRAVTDAQVRSAAASLTGALMQEPPMVSAVKVGGRRLHELARAGLEVERPARPVTVARFCVEPVPGSSGVWRALVDCSTGTYIRVLASELGVALGGGAHLRNLRRTAVGHFTLADACPVESPKLLPMASAVRGMYGVQVGRNVEAKVRNGCVLTREQLGLPMPGSDDQLHCRGTEAGYAGGGIATGRTSARTFPSDGRGDGPWAVHDSQGLLLAVYESHPRGAKPMVVMAVPD